MDDAYRRRLAVIAEGMARLERESARREAAATPEQRLRKGLQLSEFVRRTDTVRTKPLPPSLVALYRSRQRVPA